jgi:hypothetical protein
MRTLRPTSRAGIAIRLAIVALTVTTGWIHLTLGGLLFELNGLGYLVAAAAIVVPIGVAVRFRWLVRLGLAGYAVTAIIGWFLMGPRYDVAYFAKAVELTLIALLGIEIWAFDGNPLRRIGRAVRPLRGA